MINQTLYDMYSVLEMGRIEYHNLTFGPSLQCIYISILSHYSQFSVSRYLSALIYGDVARVHKVCGSAGQGVPFPSDVPSPSLFPLSFHTFSLFFPSFPYLSTPKSRSS